MCNYVRITPIRSLKILDLEQDVDLEETLVQSGFDYKDWPVIRAKNQGWEIVKMEWGFLPTYVSTREGADKFRKGYTDLKGKYHIAMTTLNAKGEELLLPGKMYRDAALNRRCIILVSGFYEWRHIFPIGKRGQPLKTSVKYPYNISVKDADYFFIAGIWQPWTDKNTGETIDTLSLVTTKANEIMEQIHNSKKRMPTILTEELANEWLSEITESRISEIANFQMSSTEMTAYSIRKEFRMESDPLEEFKYPELPTLI
jgi:putative SOS response-associated peptidase YedK